MCNFDHPRALPVDILPPQSPTEFYGLKRNIIRCKVLVLRGAAIFLGFSWEPGPQPGVTQ